MAMNKYLRILVGVMILVNAAGIQYHNRVIPVITTAIGVLVIILDVYLNPTRRKVLFYNQRGPSGPAVDSTRSGMDYSNPADLTAFSAALGQSL
jgi:hypothetical protein